MNKLALFTICHLILSVHLYADTNSRDRYLELTRQYPRLTQSLGDALQGEIEITQDSNKMAELENSTGVDVGVIAESKWGWLWVNEACKFPNGHEAVFGRILMKKSLQGPAGVAVMPITQDGQIILICNFRHATRSWEIELPRGFIDTGESIIEAARREAMEESGMAVESEILLGEIPPDSGLTGNIVPIVMAKVFDKKNNAPEKEEAIEKVLALTIPEVKTAFLKGYHTCSIRGKEHRIPFRDPFLAYALLMYELKRAQSEIEK